MCDELFCSLELNGAGISRYLLRGNENMKQTFPLSNGDSPQLVAVSVNDSYALRLLWFACNNDRKIAFSDLAITCVRGWS